MKVGITGASITSAPFFYAVEKGYFREQGIGVEFERTGTSDRLIPILATNQVQVGAAGFGAGLFNALSRDVQIKVVADNGHLAPDAGSGAVVARRELLESRALADYPDLRGLTVAIPSRGTGLHITVARALEKGGLTFDDVNLVEVPFGDMSGAIANRAVDVAFHLEPFVTQGVDQSIFGVWKWQDQIYPNQQITLVMYSPEFAANADLARRFMVAWIKGARDYNDAIWKGRNREEYAQLLAQHLPVKDPALYHKMKPIGINPDGYVNVRGIQDDQEWYVANGFVRQPVNVNALVDHSFVDYALQRLGRYQ